MRNMLIFFRPSRSPGFSAYNFKFDSCPLLWKNTFEFHSLMLQSFGVSFFLGDSSHQSKAALKLLVCKGCPHKMPHSGWLKHQNVFILQFWRLKVCIRYVYGCFLLRTSILVCSGAIFVTFSCYAFLSPNLLFLWGRQSYWIKVHSDVLITSLMTTSSSTVTLQGIRGLRLQSISFWRN